MKKCAEGTVTRREITLGVEWYNPHQPSLRKTVNAVIDTGSEESYITESLAQKLQLHLVGAKDVRGLNSQHQAPIYAAGLFIPDANGQFPKVRALGLSDEELGEAIIGMDVLYHGTFQADEQKRFFFCVEHPASA